jgi:hypothetical protein
MKEFTLKKKESDFFKLNIGEEGYLIPLARSLTFEEINKMQDKENVVEFFRKHLGTDVFNALTVDQFEIVCREWQKANDMTTDGEDDDITVGES